MSTVTISSAASPVSSSFLDYAEGLRTACLRLPPLWQLKDMVAVNPFFGYAEGSFLSAADTLHRCQHAELCPAGKACVGENGNQKRVSPMISSRWRRGTRRAAGDLAFGSGRAAPRPNRSLPKHRRSIVGRPRQLAGGLGGRGGSLSLRADQGIAAWSYTVDEDLFTAWLDWASADRGMALRGLDGFGQWLGDLPATTSLPSPFACAVRASSPTPGPTTPSACCR